MGAATGPCPGPISSVGGLSTLSVLNFDSGDKVSIRPQYSHRNILGPFNLPQFGQIIATPLSLNVINLSNFILYLQFNGLNFV